MSLDNIGMWGVIVLVANIYAIIRIVGSRAEPLKKALWIVLILLLPVLGFIIWLGPVHATAIAAAEVAFAQRKEGVTRCIGIPEERLTPRCAKAAPPLRVAARIPPCGVAPGSLGITKRRRSRLAWRDSGLATQRPT